MLKGGRKNRMITLYHGSNVEINQIELALTHKGKDFGQGFYLNPNREQAASMAERVTRILGFGSPTINAYEFDESLLNHPDGLNVKLFDDYCNEWADFVVANRKNNSDTQAHNYDIVVGPIANDTVGVQIRRYIMGYISTDKLIEELRFSGNHAIQYFFGTERAINLLKKL
jgi:hypothetical protein